VKHVKVDLDLVAQAVPAAIDGYRRYVRELAAFARSRSG